MAEAVVPAGVVAGEPELGPAELSGVPARGAVVIRSGAAEGAVSTDLVRSYLRDIGRVPLLTH
ncbi:MAG: sigma-70 factor domain-containing protein, partial [Chitinophagaceae bacterium]|nr:sigma-70 factor domain-containing protein [Chitinophagaceae bacterium]